jgi:hypothetical protein
MSDHTLLFCVWICFKLRITHGCLSGGLRLQWLDIGFPERDAVTPLMTAGCLPVCWMNSIV